MRRCAVIGSPIAHSLSPLLHRTAYAELGLTDAYRYDAFEVTPATLPGFVAGLGPEWVGLSVTAPNKQALLDQGEPDPVAVELQAGNTLILGPDGAAHRVYNTDVTGLLAALARAGVTGPTPRCWSAPAPPPVVRCGRPDAWCARSGGLRPDAGRARDSLADIAGRAGIELLVQPFGRPPTCPTPGPAGRTC